MAWLTYGMFNFLLYTKSARESEIITEWAATHNLRWEKWPLKGSTFAGSPSFGMRPTGKYQSILKDIKAFQLPDAPQELQDAAEEYRLVAATAACRSAEIDDEIADELQQANAIILETAHKLTDHKAGRTGRGARSVRATPLFVDANAALSRFASQAFSGISPICETECHFWTHSLLGTGVANLALMQIRRFITKTLGEARIPDQVDLFREVTDRAVLADVMQDGPLTDQPWLQKLPSVIKRRPLLHTLGPLSPLITYLSGRDGFHTTQTSLSAPLNVLTSCSSLRWSLLTITHEMSHRVVDGVLSNLLPDPAEPDEIARSTRLLNEEIQPENLLECIQFKILQAMAELDALAPVINLPNHVTEQSLLDLISSRREEVEEIMVHVFDFIYFYGGLPELYVPAIWRSWASIPNLHRRLPHYVLRTLCAVYSKFWNSPTPTQDAVAAVEAGMERLVKTDRSNIYIGDSLAYLKAEKSKLQSQISQRIALIGIVRTFLQSPAILQTVRGQADKSAPFRGLMFDGVPIENPLRFIEANTKDEVIVTKSFWQLTRLAFDSSAPEPTRLEDIHP